MPLYEYECDACGQRFELIRKFSESEVDTCTLCGKGPVRRLLSSPAIQFKGTGWYITDYSSKGKAASESSAPKGEATKSDSGKADSGSKDSAPAAKSESAGASPAKTSSDA